MYMCIVAYLLCGYKTHIYEKCFDFVSLLNDIAINILKLFNKKTILEEVQQ